jgi:hypothetical protein
VLSRKALWPAGVIVGWAAGLFWLTSADYIQAVTVAILWTVLAGALVDRWWATALPLAMVVVLIGVAFVTDPSCSDCGEDPYPLQIYYGLFYIAIPGAVAMAIGVGVRRALRRSRRHAPPVP